MPPVLTHVDIRGLMGMSVSISIYTNAYIKSDACEHVHVKMYNYSDVMDVQCKACINDDIHIHEHIYQLPEVIGVDGIVSYGVATISRMLKNIGLFCKRAL